MANTYRRKNRGKHQSRKPRKSRKSRKSRKGGFFTMPTKESLQQSMANGKAEANKHYELAKKKAEEQIKKTQPHMDKMKIQAQSHINNANTQAKSAYNKAKYSSPTTFLAAKTAERTYSQGMKAAQPHLNNAMNAATATATEMKKQALNRAEALTRLAEASQRGVPQSNEQYGPSIATSLPTMRSQ